MHMTLWELQIQGFKGLLGYRVVEVEQCLCSPRKGRCGLLPKIFVGFLPFCFFMHQTVCFALSLANSKEKNPLGFYGFSFWIPQNTELIQTELEGSDQAFHGILNMFRYRMFIGLITLQLKQRKIGEPLTGMSCQVSEWEYCERAENNEFVF